MNLKIKLKKFQIIQNIVLILILMVICLQVLYYNNAIGSILKIFVDLIIFTGVSVLFYKSRKYLLMIIKSFRYPYALEINDLGFSGYITNQKFLRWSEIISVKMRTVQMPIGRNTHIFVYTNDPLSYLIIDTNLMKIDKDALIDLFHQKLMRNNCYNKHPSSISVDF